MTRLGIVMRLYSVNVNPQPFSRFTRRPHERKAYMKWRDDAIKWGEKYVDKYGYYSKKLWHMP